MIANLIQVASHEEMDEILQANVAIFQEEKKVNETDPQFQALRWKPKAVMVFEHWIDSLGMNPIDALSQLVSKFHGEFQFDPLRTGQFLKLSNEKKTITHDQSYKGNDRLCSGTAFATRMFQKHSNGPFDAGFDHHHLHWECTLRASQMQAPFQWVLSTGSTSRKPMLR